MRMLQYKNAVSERKKSSLLLLILLTTANVPPPDIQKRGTVIYGGNCIDIYSVHCWDVLVQDANVGHVSMNDV